MQTKRNSDSPALSLALIQQQCQPLPVGVHSKKTLICTDSYPSTCHLWRCMWHGSTNNPTLSKCIPFSSPSRRILFWLSCKKETVGTPTHPAKTATFVLFFLSSFEQVNTGRMPSYKNRGLDLRLNRRGRAPSPAYQQAMGVPPKDAKVLFEEKETCKVTRWTASKFDVCAKKPSLTFVFLQSIKTNDLRRLSSSVGLIWIALLVPVLV